MQSTDKVYSIKLLPQKRRFTLTYSMSNCYRFTY